MDHVHEHGYTKSSSKNKCIICNIVCYNSHSDFRKRKRAKTCRCEYLHRDFAVALGRFVGKTIEADRARFACQACWHEISTIERLRKETCEAEEKLKNRMNIEGYIEQTLREYEEDKRLKEAARPPRRKSYKQTMIIYLRHGQYYPAIREGVQRSKLVRRAVLRIIRHLAREEMKSFVKKPPKRLAVAQVDQSTVEEFDWRDVIRKFASKLPVLYNTLCCSLTRRRDRYKVTIRGGSCGHLIAGLGLVLGMMAKMRCVRFNVIPSLVAMSLRKHGCGQLFFDSYTRTELCCSYVTVKRILNSCAKDFHAESMPGKSSLQERADSSSDTDDSDEASDTSLDMDDSDASDTSHPEDNEGSDASSYSEASDASSHSDDSEACDTTPQTLDSEACQTPSTNAR